MNIDFLDAISRNLDNGFTRGELLASVAIAASSSLDEDPDKVLILFLDAASVGMLNLSALERKIIERYRIQPAKTSLAGQSIEALSKLTRS